MEQESAMNIIQKGNPNYPKQIKRFVCKCGCVFEAEKGEYAGTDHE